MGMRVAETRRQARPALLGTAALFLPAALAMSAEFEPSVTLGVSYTDNVSLAEDDPQDEVIFSAQPAFLFKHEGERLNADAAYVLQAFHFNDRGTNEVFHQYNAVARAALIPEALFLELGANRFQSIVDPTREIPQGNLPITSNRIDRDNYYAALEINRQFGSNVIMLARYTYDWINFGDEPDDEPGPFNNTRDSEGESAEFSIDNYQRNAGLTWALRYNWQTNEFADRAGAQELPPWEYQRAWAELGFWVSGNLRFFASGGKESPWAEPFNPDLEDDFWEVGFAVSSGERLNAEFAAGERTFGESYRGNLTFNFRRGSTTLSYSQRPTIENRNPYQLFGPLGAGIGSLSTDFGALTDRDGLGNLLSRPGSAQRFVLNEFVWTIAFNLSRTNLEIGVFDAERTEQTNAFGIPLPDGTQRGVLGSMDYTLGAKTTLRARASWSERSIVEGASGDLISAGAEIDYRLGARTRLMLQYRYIAEDSDPVGAFRDYTANTISLFVTRTF